MGNTITVVRDRDRETETGPLPNPRFRQCDSQTPCSKDVNLPHLFPFVSHCAMSVVLTNPVICTSYFGPWALLFCGLWESPQRGCCWVKALPHKTISKWPPFKLHGPNGTSVTKRAIQSNCHQLNKAPDLKSITITGHENLELKCQVASCLINWPRTSPQNAHLFADHQITTGTLRCFSKQKNTIFYVHSTLTFAKDFRIFAMFHLPFLWGCRSWKWKPTGCFPSWVRR